MDTYIVALDVFLKSFHQYFIYYFHSYSHFDYLIPLILDYCTEYCLLYKTKSAYVWKCFRVWSRLSVEVHIIKIRLLLMENWRGGYCHGGV
jgi:hypothetical protein